MTMKKKLFAAVAAAALVGAITTGTASAAGPCPPNPPGDTLCQSNPSTPGFTINPGIGPHFDTAVAGVNTYPTVGNFNDVTMNGSPQLTSAVIAPFTVIDDGGSGAGWHVTLAVGNFGDGGTPANIVDSTGMQMNAPVVSAGNADSLMGGVWGIDNGDFSGAGKTIVDADKTDTLHNGGAPVGPDGTDKVAGMGTYLVSPQVLKLVVPASAVAGAYTATATIAIVSGP